MKKSEGERVVSHFWRGRRDEIREMGWEDLWSVLAEMD